MNTGIPTTMTARATGPGPNTGPRRPGATIELQQKILAKNDRLAEDNRDWLTARGILAVNLMSSPGAGKTTLLERTAREAGPELGLAVIEGDQETTLDASRIEAAGCAVAQINTGRGLPPGRRA